MMDVPKSSRVVALSDGGETTLASGLPAPTGLAIERGALYASDRSLGQILMIASDGKGLRQKIYLVMSQKYSIRNSF